MKKVDKNGTQEKNQDQDVENFDLMCHSRFLSGQTMVIYSN
jgi:hypothetical protein